MGNSYFIMQIDIDWLNEHARKWQVKYIAVKCVITRLMRMERNWYANIENFDVQFRMKGDKQLRSQIVLCDKLNWNIMMCLFLHLYWGFADNTRVHIAALYATWKFYLQFWSIPKKEHTLLEVSVSILTWLVSWNHKGVPWEANE